MKAYEYKHIVGFEETSLAGNVYFSNYVRWQGCCREMFLRDHVPEVLSLLERGFALITTSVHCEYLAELSAFDEIIIRMRLGALTQNRIRMLFEYWRLSGAHEELIARGEQEVVCMQREGERMISVPMPSSLRNALTPYLETELND
jgi:enediyne core biosynthesis thioesterase